MRIRYLGWAGLEIETAGTTVLIDLLEDVSSMARFIGEPRGPLLTPTEAGSASMAMVTHLHSDHADPAAIARALAPEGELLRPARACGEGLETAGLVVAETGIAEHGIATRTVDPWQTVRVGPFELTAVPAADGFGDPQISWVIAAEGRRILHAGDTVFHGWWWLTKVRHGPIDTVFLPVNGPICNLPHRQPHSTLPAAMGPTQAAAAAAILEARIAVPIHYDTLNNPPIYTQVDNPAGAFEHSSRQLGVDTRVIAPGDWLELDD